MQAFQEFNRRRFLQGCSFTAAAFATPGVFAEALTATPPLTEGPFYPDRLPLDTDNDLLVINDGITPAVGEITQLTGRVLDSRGNPLRNAFVEIWQVDNNGHYIHSADAQRGGNDKNFQGYGRFLTATDGGYYFRTIKPVIYPGRTPHIHVAVSRNGRRVLTTQLLISGHPQNESDGVVRGLGDEEALKMLMVDFKPIPESKIGELAATFDIVLGRTFNEQDAEGARAGVAKPEGMRRGLGGQR